MSYSLYDYGNEMGCEITEAKLSHIVNWTHESGNMPTFEDLNLQIVLRYEDINSYCGQMRAGVTMQ